MKVFFQFQKQCLLKNRTKLKTFIKEMFELEGYELAAISFVFCSDAYLLKINQDFLQHDFYTDIITFDLASSIEERVDGEIYISSDRVKENAAGLNIDFSQELHRVMFHGVLHLCGYKDKAKKQVAIMRSKEDYYLSLFDMFHVEHQ